MAANRPQPLLRGVARNSTTDQAAMRDALADKPQMPPNGSAEAHATSGPVATNPADFVIGQKYAVPLVLCRLGANNARVFYSTQEIDDTAASLTQNGQDVAAIGYVEDNLVHIVDGVKRFKSATSAGLPTLNIEIKAKPADSATEYAISRRVNLERSTQTSLDDAVRWKEMLAAGTYADQDDLAARLKVSKATVSRIIGLNRIPERLLRMMSDHPQTRMGSIAYEISCIFGAEQFKDSPEQAEILAQHVIEETVKHEHSRANVVQLISSKLSGPKTRIRGEAQPVKYGNFKGTLKVAPSRGTLELSFKDLTQEKVVELSETIEKMLAGQLSF